MATGTHRKTAEKSVRLPRVPVGLILIGAFLFMLAIGLVVLLAASSHGQPGTQAWPAQAARVMATEALGINGS